MNKIIGLFLLILSLSVSAIDLSPINNQNWTYENVRHLLLRSGFDATPEKIETLLKSSPKEVVLDIVYFKQEKHNKFIESGIFDPSLDPFPPSRPYLTKYAKLKQLIGLGEWRLDPYYDNDMVSQKGREKLRSKFKKLLFIKQYIT